MGVVRWVAGFQSRGLEFPRKVRPTGGILLMPISWQQRLAEMFESMGWVTWTFRLSLGFVLAELSLLKVGQGAER